MYHGPIRIGAVYLAGVLSGALITSITDPESFLAGASGGVYALLLGSFFIMKRCTLAMEPFSRRR